MKWYVWDLLSNTLAKKIKNEGWGTWNEIRIAGCWLLIELQPWLHLTPAKWHSKCRLPSATCHFFCNWQLWFLTFSAEGIKYYRDCKAQCLAKNNCPINGSYQFFISQELSWVSSNQDEMLLGEGRWSCEWQLSSGVVFPVKTLFLPWHPVETSRSSEPPMGPWQGTKHHDEKMKFTQGLENRRHCRNMEAEWYPPARSPLQLYTILSGQAGMRGEPEDETGSVSFRMVSWLLET